MKHPIAFWTGFTAFCGNIAALKVLNVIGSEGKLEAQLIASVILSLAVGGVAYGRERITEAKQEWTGEERRKQHTVWRQYPVTEKELEEQNPNA